MTDNASPKPALTLRVGVTGHRPNKLADADVAAIRARVDDVLATLREAVQDLHNQETAHGDRSAFRTTEAPDLRLVTALAEGSDTLVAEAAVEAGYHLDLVLPYPQARYEADFTSDGVARFRELMGHSAVGAACALDVTSAPHDPAAYQAAGEVLLEHADVVIAVWDGNPADGHGGTAEVVRDAQARGTIVVRVALDGSASIWLPAEHAVDPVTDGVWADPWGSSADDALPLADRVTNHLAPPQDGQARAYLDAYFAEAPCEGSYACGYKMLRGILLGDECHPRVDYGVAEKRQSGWAPSLEAARDLGGADFAARLRERLKERWLRADCLAVHYAHRYRTAFITNFLLAAGAVFVGLLAVPVWGSLSGKAVLVAFELAFIGAILWQTRHGHSGRWHERWLDYRNVAEALRPARLPLLMGSSPTRAGNLIGLTPGQTWIAWYVRAVLREIPPPTGVIDAHALRRVIDVATADEIDDQLAYHGANTAKLDTLDHRLEWLGELFLKLTIAVGVGFLLAFGATFVLEAKPVAKAVKPWATFLGGVLPVLGAAMFAIRATGDFRTAAHQSARTHTALETVRAKLAAERDDPARDRTRQLLSETTHSMSDDLRVWALIYSERTLTPGF